MRLQRQGNKDIVLYRAVHDRCGNSASWDVDRVVTCAITMVSIIHKNDTKYYKSYSISYQNQAKQINKLKL
jgi:hypothetical protein